MTVVCNYKNYKKLFENINDDYLLELSNLFKIIGDNTRTKILYVLSLRETCVCDIARQLNMTKSAISHQLKVLKDYKLVDSRKDGKEVYYKLADEHVLKLFNLAIDHIMEENYEGKD